MMSMQNKPKRQPSLSWFPIGANCRRPGGRYAGQSIWTIRHVDQPGRLFVSPEDWDMMFPGQGTSPTLGFDSLRMASFIAIPMPEKLHSSLVSHPNTRTEPSTPHGK